MNPDDYPPTVINPPNSGAEPPQPPRQQQPPTPPPTTTWQQQEAAPYTPQPTPPTQPPTTTPNSSDQPPLPPKKKSPWLFIGIIVVTVLVVVGVIAAVLLSRSSTSNDAESATQTQETKAIALHEALLTDLQKTTGASDLLHTTAPLGYKVRGYDYATVVASNDAGNISVGQPDIDAARTASNIDSLFRDKAYKSQAINAEADASYNDNRSYTNYFNTDIFCSRYLDTSPHFASEARGDTVVNVACVDLATISDTAATQKPYYDAFVKADAAHAGLDRYVLGAPSEKASATNGFQIASMPYAAANERKQIGGSVLLFYKTPNAKEWTFFAAADELLSCATYTQNAVAKKAFLGEACIEPDTQSVSTVR